MSFWGLIPQDLTINKVFSSCYGSSGNTLQADLAKYASSPVKHEELVMISYGFPYGSDTYVSNANKDVSHGHFNASIWQKIIGYERSYDVQSDYGADLIISNGIYHYIFKTSFSNQYQNSLRIHSSYDLYDASYVGSGYGPNNIPDTLDDVQEYLIDEGLNISNLKTDEVIAVNHYYNNPNTGSAPAVASISVSKIATRTIVNDLNCTLLITSLDGSADLDSITDLETGWDSSTFPYKIYLNGELIEVLNTAKKSDIYKCDFTFNEEITSNVIKIDSAANQELQVLTVEIGDTAWLAQFRTGRAATPQQANPCHSYWYFKSGTSLNRVLLTANLTGILRNTSVDSNANESYSTTYTAHYINDQLNSKVNTNSIVNKIDTSKYNGSNDKHIYTAGAINDLQSSVTTIGGKVAEIENTLQGALEQIEIVPYGYGLCSLMLNDITTSISRDFSRESNGAMYYGSPSELLLTIGSGDSQPNNFTITFQDSSGYSIETYQINHTGGQQRYKLYYISNQQPAQVTISRTNANTGAYGFILLYPLLNQYGLLSNNFNYIKYTTASDSLQLQAIKNLIENDSIRNYDIKLYTNLNKIYATGDSRQYVLITPTAVKKTTEGGNKAIECTYVYKEHNATDIRSNTMIIYVNSRGQLEWINFESANCFGTNDIFYIKPGL